MEMNFWSFEKKKDVRIERGCTVWKRLGSANLSVTNCNICTISKNPSEKSSQILATATIKSVLLTVV